MSLLQKRAVWITLLIVSFLIGCFTRWQLGLALPFLSVTASLSVLTAATPGFYQFVRSNPSSRGWLVVFALCAFALGVEILGIQTGFPYGSFAYHPTLQTQLILGVPWTTPFGWLPLVFASFTAAQAITQRQRSYRNVLIGLVILVAMDLVLDPGAVSLGLWQYLKGGLYYGVPLSNFFGWSLTGAIALFFTHKALSAASARAMPLFTTLIGPASLLSFWLGINTVSKHVIPSFIGAGLLVLFTAIWQARSTKIDRSQSPY